MVFPGRFSSIDSHAPWSHRYPLALIWSCVLRGLALMPLTGIGFYLGTIYSDHLTGTQLGSAFAMAAAVGFFSRWWAGRQLDQGTSWRQLLAWSALAMAVGIFQLRDVNGWQPLLLGMALQGVGLGLFWPSVEIAVADTRGEQVLLTEAFTLARFLEAIGAAAGVAATAGFTALGQPSLAFISAAILLLLLAVAALLTPAAPADKGNTLTWKRLLKAAAVLTTRASRSDSAATHDLQPSHQTVPNSYLGLLRVTGIPALFLVSVVATSIIILQQSALPLDLVRGGLGRQPLGPMAGNLLLALQTTLLMLLQWPVGRLLTRWPKETVLRWSLLAFAGGQGSLALSFLPAGQLAALVLAQVLTAFGIAGFLPTASTAILELTPTALEGRAMAAYSGCWGLSSIVAPPLAGWMLEQQGHSLGLWLFFMGLCFASTRLTVRIGGALKLRAQSLQRGSS